MRRSDYEKRLIVQKIDAQRRVARVDWLELRDSFQPWTELARLAGALLPLLAPVRGIARAMGSSDENGKRKRGWLRWSTVIAAAIPLALVLLGRRD